MSHHIPGVAVTVQLDTDVMSCVRRGRSDYKTNKREIALRSFWERNRNSRRSQLGCSRLDVVKCLGKEAACCRNPLRFTQKSTLAVTFSLILRLGFPNQLSPLRYKNWRVKELCTIRVRNVRKLKMSVYGGRPAGVMDTKMARG